MEPVGSSIRALGELLINSLMSAERTLILIRLLIRKPQPEAPKLLVTITLHWSSLGMQQHHLLRGDL